MAVAGSMCSAYACQIVDGALRVRTTFYPRAECPAVEDAVAQLSTGVIVHVAGTDMSKLREAVRALGVYA